MTRLLIATVLPLLAAENEDAKKDLAAMQGAWTVVKMERGGMSAPDELLKTLKVTIKDNVMSLNDGRRDEPINFKLDPSAKPKAMDMIPPKRVARKDGGEVPEEITPAIYEIGGDDLKICWRKGGEGGARPTEFGTGTDRGLMFMVLKREKK